MKFIEYSKKLEEIKNMAQRHVTGPPSQLASKLKVSSRTVERMVQQLREQGYRISFDRNRNTYVMDNLKKRTSG